jgi:hypothetical protein
VRGLNVIHVWRLFGRRISRARPEQRHPPFFRLTSSRGTRLDSLYIRSTGLKIPVALPTGLPINFRAITFSPDGRAIYGQETEPLNRSIGILKIEFQPASQGVIPGSIGTGEVRCLSVSSSSRRIVISGWSWSQGEGGIFEIDPDAGTSRALPAALPSLCGGAGGLTSPDGKRAVSHSGKKLELLDLNTRAVQPMKGVGAAAFCEWAPDGLSIACISNRRLFLVDATKPSQSKDLRTSGSGPVAWSPDSKRLLLMKSQVSCLPTLYGQSLEVMDLQTGKKVPVKSSHCGISGGSIGWVDRAVAQ